MLIKTKFEGYTRAGIRLYPGGGGGGDPGAAAREMEAERQARITAATEQINSIFNNKVQGEETRYKKSASVSPMSFFGGRAEPQYMTADSYATQKAAYDKALAVNMSNGSNPYGQAGFGGFFGSQNQDLLAANELTATQLGFDPSLWNSEQYSTMVDGDPANSRDQLYADQKSAVYDLNSQEVDRQAGEAEQANRFGLARSGLSGGSVDIDSNSELDRRTNEGLLRAGGIADQSAADLKAADERTRSNLISMAQSGIDTGSAATMALNGLKVNADSVAAQRSGSTVGSLFNDMSQAYLYNQKGLGTATGSANPYQQEQQFGSMGTRNTYAGQ